MTKYIIKNWAGDEMPWGSFESIDQAYDEVDHRVTISLILEGYDNDGDQFDIEHLEAVSGYHVVNNNSEVQP